MEMLPSQKSKVITKGIRNIMLLVTAAVNEALSDRNHVSAGNLKSSFFSCDPNCHN
jgi:hypothetical protein